MLLIVLSHLLQSSTAHSYHCIYPSPHHYLSSINIRIPITTKMFSIITTLHSPSIMVHSNTTLPSSLHLHTNITIPRPLLNSPTLHSPSLHNSPAPHSPSLMLNSNITLPSSLHFHTNITKPSPLHNSPTLPSSLDHNTTLPSNTLKSSSLPSRPRLLGS